MYLQSITLREEAPRRVLHLNSLSRYANFVSPSYSAASRNAARRNLRDLWQLTLAAIGRTTPYELEANWVRPEVELSVNWNQSESIWTGSRRQGVDRAWDRNCTDRLIKHRVDSVLNTVEPTACWIESLGSEGELGRLLEHFVREADQFGSAHAPNSADPLHLEAEEIRRKIDELMEERATWEADDEEHHQAIEMNHAEMVQRLAGFEDEIRRLVAEQRGIRAKQAQAKDAILALRGKIQAWRPLASQTVTRSKVVTTPNAPALTAESTAQLSELEKRIKKWRAAQHRLDGRITAFREELALGIMTTDEKVDPLFEAVRRSMFQFENYAEHLITKYPRLIRENEDGDAVLLTHDEMKSSCDRLYGQLHNLYEALNERYAAVTRREMVWKLRQFHRVKRDIERHVTKLEQARERIISKLTSGRVLPTSAPVTSVVSTVDRRAVQEHNQLRQVWESELNQLSERLSQWDSEWIHIANEINALERDKSRLAESLRTKPVPVARNRHRLAEINGLISELRSRYEDLVSRIAAYVPSPASNPLLDRAGEILARLSGNRWNQVRLAGDGDVNLIDSLGHRASIWNVSQSDRALTHFAFATSLLEVVDQSRLDLPIILLEPFAQLDRDDAGRLSRLLVEIANQGRQVIVMSDDFGGLAGERGWTHLELADWQVVEQPEKPVTTRVPSLPPEDSFRHRRVIMQRNNNSDAEEFPGEFTDQVYVEDYPVDAEIDGDKLYATADAVEAYDDGLSEIELMLTDDFDPDLLVDRVLGAEHKEARSAEIQSDEGLEVLSVFTPEQLAHLKAFGIKSLSDFGNANRDQLARACSTFMNLDELLELQTATRLMLQMPSMRPFDARILAACGVTEAMDLARWPSFEIVDRVNRLRTTERGRKLLRLGNDYELSRLASWIQSLQQARPVREFGFQDRSGSESEVRDVKPAKSNRESNARSERVDTLRPESNRPESNRPETNRSTSNRTENGRSESSRELSERERVSKEQFRASSEGERRVKKKKVRSERVDGAHVGPPHTVRFARQESGAITETSSPKKEKEALVFHLELSSNIEAAPSIGPKVAKLLEGIGIESIEDFLGYEPEEISEWLDDSKFSSSLISKWQKQTALVLRVPNLRGHDAQILVACGIETAEDLAAADADELYSIVAPFVESKEGERVLRTSPKPDLDEVHAWIRWAQKHRNVQAA